MFQPEQLFKSFYIRKRRLPLYSQDDLISLYNVNKYNTRVLF